MLQAETQPKPIPRRIRRELSDLLIIIDRGKDIKEIKHIIDAFRLIADPVIQDYDRRQSNEQIHLLNEHLANKGYAYLQVHEY